MCSPFIIFNDFSYCFTQKQAHMLFSLVFEPVNKLLRHLIEPGSRDYPVEVPGL